MKTKNDEVYKEVLEFLEQLDEEDKRFILVNYDEEEIEPTFRFEYQFESLTETESIFRKNRSIW
mgnify:CR=1 FL=1